jgi:EmrB/QacA subfamily drug resistance transporter
VITKLSGERRRLPVELRDPRTFLVLVALSVALLLTELDQSVFATALPTVVGELGGVEHQLWVGTGYVLAAAVVMPVLGRLSDLVGRRRVLTVALLVFVAGSIVGGVAPTMEMVIVARVLQGLGGGGLLIVVQAVVADIVAPSRRALVLSVIGAVFAAAAIGGPVVGGGLTDSVGWRWVFWMNVPLGLAAAVAVWRWLPASAGARRPVRVDLPGMLCLAVAVVAGVLVLVWGGTTFAWGSRIILTLTGFALVAIAALVTIERRAAEPILPPRLFRNRAFVLAIGAGAVVAVAMFGTVNYLPTYLQMVHALSPTRAGMFMLTLVVGLGAATVLAGRVVQRTRRAKPLPVVGAGLMAVALMLGSQLEPTTPLPVVGLGLLLLGAGIGCAWEVLVVVVQDLAPVDDLGAATAVNGFVRELGVLVGTAWVGRLFTSGLVDRLGALDLPPELTPAALGALSPESRVEVAQAYADAFTPVFGWLLPVLVVATIGLLVIPSRRLADQREPVQAEGRLGSRQATGAR